MANTMRLTLLLTATDQMTRTVANAARSSMAAMNSMQAGMQRRANIARTNMLDAGMAAFGGAAALRYPLEMAGNYERLRVSMDALTGSAVKGGKLFNDVIQLAANTPLELDQVAQVTSMLLGMGDSAENVTANVKMLGDITALTNGDLNRAAIAYGQARQMGKLLTRDIYQMINAGIPLNKMFKDVYGQSFDIYKQAESGTLTFDRLQEVLVKTTTANGQFANGLQKLSSTGPGVWVRLKDEVGRFAAVFGDAVLPALKQLGEALIPILSSMAEFVKNNQWVAKAVMYAVGAFTALATIGLVLNATIWAGATAIGGFVNLWNILGKTVIGVEFIIKGFTYTLWLLEGVWIVVSYAATSFATVMTGTVIPAILKFIPAMWTAFAPALAIIGVVGAIVIAITAAIVITVKAIQKWKEWGAAVLMMMGPFGAIINTIMSLKTHWQSIKDAFTNGGILKGLLRIGQVLLDAVLFPLEQLMGIAAKITGLDMFSNASKRINDIRARMDLTEATSATKAVAEATGQSVTSQTVSNSSTSNTIAPVSSGGTAFNYSPVLNIAAGVSESAIANIVENDRREFAKQMEDVMRRKAERRYA